MMILAVCIINQSISQSINQATLLTKGSGITDIVIRTQIYNRIQLRQTDIEVCTKGRSSRTLQKFSTAFVDMVDRAEFSLQT